MTANFDQIQAILRKLSPKQLRVVQSMTNDLLSAEQDRQARRIRPKPPTASQHNRKYWSSDDGEISDEEYIKSSQNGFPVLPKSTEQMERIVGAGAGHQLAQLSEHLDSIGMKHGVFDHSPFDDLYEG